MSGVLKHHNQAGTCTKREFGKGAHLSQYTPQKILSGHSASGPGLSQGQWTRLTPDTERRSRCVSPYDPGTGN